MELPAEFPGSILFCPEQPVAALMLLHGAEGHPALWVQGLAAYLAQRGIATLYYAWYGDTEGLPPQIIDVPIGRAMQALHWLKAEFNLKTALYGFSRGAELAAIIASIRARSTEFPAPDGLILHAGTNVINIPLSWDWAASATPYREDMLKFDYSVKPWHWDDLVDAVEVGDRIPIEKYPGPVLLVHGAEDQTYWVGQAGYILHRLNGREGQPGLVRELIFKGEGHAFSPPAEKLMREAMVDFIVNQLADAC